MVSGPRVFLRYFQLNRQHGVGVDAGHTVDAPCLIPGALLPLQVEAFFRAYLCADPAADAVIRDVV